MKRLAIADLASVLGLPCWQVRWDSQVGLDMNFGRPTIEVMEPRVSRARSARVRAMFRRRRVFLQGTHWLEISPYKWTIRLGDGLKATSSSSMRRQDLACGRLEGEKLEAIVIDRLSGRAQFHFDLGAMVTARGGRVTPFAEFDLWSVHARKRGRFVAVYAGGGFRAGALSGDGDVTRSMSLDGSERFLVVGTVPRRRRGTTYRSLAV